MDVFIPVCIAIALAIMNHYNATADYAGVLNRKRVIWLQKLYRRRTCKDYHAVRLSWISIYVYWHIFKYLDEASSVGSQYLRQCESEQYAIAIIREEFRIHGVTEPNLRTLVCDGDGAYGAYNISSGMYEINRLNNW